MVVTVSGEANEQLRSADLASGLSGWVIFDLDGLIRVTSFGVREWVAAITQLDVDFYAFVNCRPAVVVQFNMVARFGGIGDIISLYLPYLCRQCGEEFDVLLDLRQDYDVVRRGEPPETRCPTCGSEAEFDDIPEHYFSFVANRPEPKLPSRAERLLSQNEEAAAAPERFAIAKSVDGVVTTIKLSGPLDGGARLKRLAEGLEGYVLVDVAELTTIDDGTLKQLCECLMEPRAEETYFIQCPTPFVEAFSRVFLAVPHSIPRIATVLRPGICTACGTQADKVDCAAATVSESATEVLRALSRRCEACGGDQFELVDSSRLSEQLVGEPSEEVWASIGKGGVLGLSSPPPSTPYEVRRELERLTSKKYKLIRRIGTGGMAEVFLARQSGLQDFQKLVVIKRILSTFSESPVFVDLFLQEARIAARISHPNVVQIFDLGTDEGRYFMAMEYVEGWDLREILNHAKDILAWMPAPIACRIVSDVCAGLHAAHTVSDEGGEPYPIIHRDVSPHNVLISSAGAVKVTDFGIAKAIGSFNETNPGTIKGKVPYLAPEQILDPDAVSPQTDVFAAGLILYECLTYVSPFRRGSDFETMKTIVEYDVPSVLEVRSDLPKELDTVLRRATSRDLSKRYASALEFSMALEALLVGYGSVTTSHQVAQWLREFVESSHPARAAWGRSPLDQTDSLSAIDVELDELIQLDTRVTQRLD